MLSWYKTPKLPLNNQLNNISKIWRLFFETPYFFDYINSIYASYGVLPRSSLIFPKRRVVHYGLRAYLPLQLPIASAYGVRAY